MKTYNVCITEIDHNEHKTRVRAESPADAVIKACKKLWGKWAYKTEINKIPDVDRANRPYGILLEFYGRVWSSANEYKGKGPAPWLMPEPQAITKNALFEVY